MLFVPYSMVFINGRYYEIKEINNNYILYYESKDKRIIHKVSFDSQKDLLVYLSKNGVM